MVYYLKNTSQASLTSDCFDIDEKVIASLKSVKSNATCAEVGTSGCD